MNTNAHYLHLKAHLNATFSQLFIAKYRGQYQAGSRNTNLKSPALYVELPDRLQVTHYPHRVQVARDVVIGLHVLTNQLYKYHDGAGGQVGEQAHEALCEAITALIEGWNIPGAQPGKIGSQQLVFAGTRDVDPIDQHLITVLEFSTELYNL